MRRLLPKALVLMALLCLTACKTELYSGLNEREANEIVAALSSEGIPASKTRTGRDEGITVQVDEGRFAEAMHILEAHGLPGRKYDSMGDVFRKEGFVSSPTEERARMIYALSQELSQTVAEIDGVLTARIHVVLPDTDMLGRDTKPSSASVFLRYSADQDVERYTSQIKLLVANSIEGLVYDNISVVMVPSSAPANAHKAQTPGYISVLGVWVHPASLMRFKGMVALAAVLLLATTLLALRPFWPATARAPLDDGF